MGLLLAFILVPLIEIGLFIQVGGFIGLWPTLLIVLITAVLGANLVRSQGLRELNKLRGSFAQLDDPTEPLAHGAMILFAGALLLTPGFFTDTIGFLLLVPQVRRFVMRKMASRVKMQTFTMGTTQSRYETTDTIDGEFTVQGEDQPRPTHPSGWTRH